MGVTARKPYRPSERPNWRSSSENRSSSYRLSGISWAWAAGQTIISKTLLEQEGVNVVEAVAICLEMDEKIRAALRKHGCEADVETDPKESVHK